MPQGKRFFFSRCAALTHKCSLVALKICSLNVGFFPSAPISPIVGDTKVSQQVQFPMKMLAVAAMDLCCSPMITRLIETTQRGAYESTIAHRRMGMSSLNSLKRQNDFNRKHGSSSDIYRDKTS